MSPIVKLTNVSKSFGQVRVLEDVSFDVAQGKVVALIGRSGSGKSTALRCVNGLEKIDGGEEKMSWNGTLDSSEASMFCPVRSLPAFSA